MSGLIYVLILVFAVVVPLILVKVGWKPSKLKAYFWDTKQGKGILKGIVLGVGVLVVAGSLMTCANNVHAQPIKVPGTFFNDASVFMGLDHTKKLSPQCVAGGIDDRTTSNLGARLNVWQSPAKDVRFNLQYTHHSCALNVDRNGYDAIGVQVEWTPWRRN
ncbi:hypothetical protein FDI24_gp191 [Acidovorax phage ACP17]|uniref:Uncharacterized protein n=1 Tax=Acidovorax phage ACP17 TaxID=2010329 RepID=A0A218M343_9CAUD|nr:hypothetical protein FDI24_gp191 [Acidovorax phage ACP17]ASD50473.1 hypothetical protein [Acidovorax phage ACP17]